MTPQKEQTSLSHKRGYAREGENLPSACVTQKRKGRARVANVAKIEKGRDRDKGAVRERIDDGDLRDPVDNEQHERCRKPEDKTPRSGAPGCGSIDLGHGV